MLAELPQRLPVPREEPIQELSPVRIGEVTFDFEPTPGDIADEFIPGRRSSDERLDRSHRPGAADRLAAKKGRRSSGSDDEADDT
jgi:hypothetical protein